MSGIGSAEKLSASAHGFGEPKPLTSEQQLAVEAIAELQVAAESLKTTVPDLIATLSEKEQEGAREAIRILKTLQE